MDLILSLLQQMCVYLMLAYMLSKTPIFIPLFSLSNRVSHKFSIYVLFSLFCILGTYFGLQINDAIANTRAIGAVMGGLFGGPLVGFAVGLTGGIHRYTLGGFTDLACTISTTAEGLIGGVVHLYFIKKKKKEALFNPLVVLYVTFTAEIIQMLLILAIAKPFDQAAALVADIAAPMIIANSIGAAFFMSILQDRKTIFEEYSATFSRRALNIAERSVGILVHGFNTDNASKIARIIYEETNVGAVAITDNDKILAFVGIGDDHHKLNRPISSQSTLDSITENRIIYLDGKDNAYQCSISQDCKLGSALIIPLRTGDKVIGTIKLYEPKRKLFSTINMSMAEGIAQLLSSQILHGEYIHKQTLLNQSEIKLLQAQVNPHFLFNALNTISAITRRDPDKARSLIQHLSQFFRSNLKQNIETVSLKEELAHVNAYLTIEKARFTDRLSVEMDIELSLLERAVPSFTLQPLVENAIKHGISTKIEGGKIRIYSEETADGHRVIVEDNAGTFIAPEHDHEGLGMQIVDKRLSNKFGRDAALKIEVENDTYTRMSFIIPAREKTTETRTTITS
ncbi:histidine kinase [Vibrio sp. 10N.286.49.C2]|uniref:sensor histidine kinase n=1 Tax=unclassified Vibrio TaxID=2614977 RepID=UPI000C85F20D|nr:MULTISPECIES: sensor histidine kinase [unclassified Vibrio]PMH27644.1 histidine kinase [Vibrio sp. 10N.286.49.C2]PMH53070.1 histidine kinase [Vibrio sp. 10N.286.49.B1]PMH79198.1 histidine kinase [Vibrio sp. 10N.286.48.B7]